MVLPLVRGGVEFRDNMFVERKHIKHAITLAQSKSENAPARRGLMSAPGVTGLPQSPYPNQLPTQKDFHEARSH